MKVVALISGGKDSCYAMMRCLDYGHEIVALANLLPMDDSVDELDSFMYQTVGHQIVMAYAQCMGLPLFRRRIRGLSRAQDLRYTQTYGDEVEDLFLLLREVQKQYPTLAGVSCGAIASDYQRMRVENVCSRLGLVSLAFLWKQEQADLLQQMIAHGIQAVLVKVASMGLNPHTHLGKDLAEMQPLLTHLNTLYGINVCGEGGEYETLTLDCPLFKNFKIVMDTFDIILHSPDSIAPVGVLHPSKFHLQCKTLESSSKQPGLTPCVREVEGSFEKNLMQQQEDDACTLFPVKQRLLHDKSKLEFCLASRRHGSFVILSSWTRSCISTCGIEEELGFVLTSINDELKQDDLSWGNVLYIHLYINDMGAFTLANQTYMKNITEKLCVRGVPSRSTVGLALLDSNMGRIMVEAIAAKEMDKKVLHVQSISCWAPSCIGPYSQATLFHGMLYMAGQLGLDPPTMALVSGGAASEMNQAFQNCEAVAQAFSASVVQSSVSILIYCSSSVGLVERKEAGIVLEKFLQSCRQGNDGVPSSPTVPVLYVQVPALPKGAALEVEPFLFVPARGEEFVNGNLRLERAVCGEACRGTIVSGRFCRAFFSVSQKRQLECVHNESGFCALHSESLPYICGELKLCLQAFSELLDQASLHWENVLALRVMFVAERILYSTVVEAWKHAVNEALSSSICTTQGKPFTYFNNPGLSSLEPLFLPVLSTGKDTNMDDLITLDLLALL